MVRFLLDHPVGVFMILTALLIAGTYSIFHIPVSLLPSGEIPVINITTRHDGFSPQQIEKYITSPIRDELLGLNKMTGIKANSFRGLSRIRIEVEHGASTDNVIMDIHSRLDRAIPRLPETARRPVVAASAISDEPVFVLSVYYAERNQGISEYDFFKLSQFVSRSLKNRIQQLEGTAYLEISGTCKSSSKAFLDLDLANSLGLKPENIMDALSSSGIHSSFVSAEGNYRFMVEQKRAAESDSSYAHKMVELKGGGKVPLSSLFLFRNTYDPVNGGYSYGGRKAIAIAVYQRSGTRAGSLKDDVISLMDTIVHEYDDIDYAITKDQVRVMEESVDGLYLSIVLAVLFSSILLLLLMHDVKSTLILIVSIPTAVIITILGSTIAGLSINMVTLTGLVLCIGMITDNSLIIADNIYLHVSAGMKPTGGIISGTEEVIRPLLSSTLTTCAVFIPFLVISGPAGALFREQAIIVIMGISVSLVLGITVIPVLFSTILGNRSKVNVKESKIIRLYEQAEGVVLQKTVVFWIIFLMMGLLSIVLYVFLSKRSVPEMPANEYVCRVNMKRSPDKHALNHLLNNIEEEISKSGVKISTFSGGGQKIIDWEYMTNNNSSLFFLSSGDRSMMAKAVRQLDSLLAFEMGINDYTIAPYPNIFERIFGRSDNEMSLIFPVESYDPDDIEVINREFYKYFNKKDIKYHTLQESSASFEMVMNTEVLLHYDVSPEEILGQVGFLNGGILIKSGSWKGDLLILPQGNVFNDHLLETVIYSANGNPIALKDIISVIPAKSIEKITSGTSGPYVSFTIDTTDIDKIIRHYKHLVDESDIPVELAGSFVAARILEREILVSLIMVITLLYFILAAQFESLLQPLIILGEIFLVLGGVFLLLILTDQSLNLVSGTGIMIMCGIVINDSILKMDMINRLAARGMDLEKAIIEGGKRRFRPIVTTSLTTIFSVLPVLFADGLGASIQYSYAIALIGGLTVGTFTSLFFIPLAYRLIYRPKR